MRMTRTIKLWELEPLTDLVEKLSSTVEVKWWFGTGAVSLIEAYLRLKTFRWGRGIQKEILRDNRTNAVSLVVKQKILYMTF